MTTKGLFSVKSLLLIASISLISLAFAIPRADSRLRIYYTDVEGGASTLIVTPAGESILIDAGWSTPENRDPQRIVKTMKAAGVSRIDHFILTHYHRDHWGGIAGLKALVPISRFYDHGPVNALLEDNNFAQNYADYQKLTEGKSTVLRPGDQIKLKQAHGTKALTLTCFASAGAVMGPSETGPRNPECETAKLKNIDFSDNARSLAMVIKFGNFDFMVGGDLTWNRENKLVCPTNLIGKIDLFQVTHHGLNASNSTTMLRSISPTAAIMNNGARKGGNADVIKAIRELPSIEAFYQLHKNMTIPSEANVPDDFIANLTTEGDQAFSITVVTDGKTFTITNTRNGKSTTHQVR